MEERDRTCRRQDGHCGTPIISIESLQVVNWLLTHITLKAIVEKGEDDVLRLSKNRTITLSQATVRKQHHTSDTFGCRWKSVVGHGWMLLTAIKGMSMCDRKGGWESMNLTPQANTSPCAFVPPYNMPSTKIWWHTTTSYHTLPTAFESAVSLSFLLLSSLKRGYC